MCVKGEMCQVLPSTKTGCVTLLRNESHNGSKGQAINNATSISNTIFSDSRIPSIFLKACLQEKHPGDARFRCFLHQEMIIPVLHAILLHVCIP